MEEGSIYSLDFIREEIKKIITRFGDDLGCINITYDIYGRDNSSIWKVVPILSPDTKPGIPLTLNYGGSIRIGDGYEFVASGFDYNYEEKLELVISECRKVYYALRKEFPLLHRNLARCPIDIIPKQYDNI